ncbi:MAG: hypothetical protein ACP5NQ_09450, partial [Vulcanisaeta sp.]
SNVSPWIYIFSFSRSGYGFVIKCPPGDYVNPMDYMRCGSRSIEDTISDWLNGVNFRIRSPELRELLNELFSEFVAMANEVKKYWRSIGGELSFGGHAPRLVEFFNNPRVYYFTELSIPGDSGRIRGIKTTMSLIYENWVATKIAEALDTRGLIRRSWETGELFINKPVTVWFEQGGETSYAILDTPYGAFTMWLEFQVDPAIHVFPNPELIRESDKIIIPIGHKHRRRAVRPDIVIARSKFDSVGDLVKSGKEIDVLIECKVLPYEDWKGDIDGQVIPYVKQFKPKKAILVTRYAVPSSVKMKLNNNGVEVIENIRPGGSGIAKLRDVMKDVIT